MTLQSCYTNLSNEQINEIKEAFDKFDLDGDGTITLSEIKEVMISMGQNPTDSELKQMLSEHTSKSRSYVIQFPEFLTMMTRKMDNNDMDNEIAEVSIFLGFMFSEKLPCVDTFLQG